MVEGTHVQLNMMNLHNVSTYVFARSRIFIKLGTYLITFVPQFVPMCFFVFLKACQFTFMEDNAALLCTHTFVSV